jgi:hypothetical protein
MVTAVPRVGDVFAVPTGDGRAGIGQVLQIYLDNAYFFAIFPGVVSLSPTGDEVADALRSVPSILALSQDAKLHAGHWPVLGSSAVNPAIMLPEYKVAVDRGDGIHFEVENATATQSRRVSNEEAARLAYRKVVAPVRLERAFRASLGLEPWLEHYDELRYPPQIGD